MTAAWGGREARGLSDLVKAEYGYLCHLCLTPIAEDNYTVDHIIPRNKGGLHNIENLRPAHGKKVEGICDGNFARGDKDIALYRAEHTNELNWFAKLEA